LLYPQIQVDLALAVSIFTYHCTQRHKLRPESTLIGQAKQPKGQDPALTHAPEK
jgi:hypothetical protein